MSACQTFGDGGAGSGIAEALRAVDCMSGEAAQFAFGAAVRHGRRCSARR